MKYSKVPLVASFLLLVAVAGTRSQPQVQSRDVHYLRGTGRTVDVKIPPPLHFRNRQIDLPTSKFSSAKGQLPRQLNVALHPSIQKHVT